MKASRLNAKLVKGIKAFFSKARKKKAVFGLSGGLDSALCAVLLTRALGAKNVTALLMPVKGVSSKKNILDAKKLAKGLKIKHFVVELNSFAVPFSKLSWKQPKIARSNLFARLRAVVLFNFANSKNAIVCGTGNKTELLLGYFTKFGDGAVDFLPIGGIYKTQVRELAVYHRLPEEFIKKAPSAELWPGQADEKEIGIKYEEIDRILKLAVERKKTKPQAVKAGHSKKAVGRIFSLLEKNRHKTRLPPAIGV